MVGRIYDDKEPSEPPRIRTPTRTSENTSFYELRRPARPSARAPWTISTHRAPLGSWARNLSSVRFVFPRLRNSPVSAELLRDPFSDVAQLGSRMRCAGLHCVACSEVLVARNTCEEKVGAPWFARDTSKVLWGLSLWVAPLFWWLAVQEGARTPHVRSSKDTPKPPGSKQTQTYAMGRGGSL